MLALGAIGGTLNALLTDNFKLWPSAIRIAADKRIIRPGFIANVSIGAAATLVLFSALAEGGCVVRDRSIWSASMVVVTGMFIGLTAARSVTNESDKRLLRAATCKACAAPAAHPDSVRAIEVGSPYTVYALTDTLIPRRAVVPPSSRDVTMRRST